MTWLEFVLFFIGGFGLGYGLANRFERKRINTIIGYIDRIDRAEARVREKEREKVSKGQPNNTPIKLVMLFIFLILSPGCGTVGYIGHISRSTILEIRCGIGKDYICSPQFRDEGVEIVCGCIKNEILSLSPEEKR